MIRQNQRDTIRNRAVAIQYCSYARIVRIVRIAVDQQICPVLLFQKNSGTSGFIRIDVCIRLEFEIGPLRHLNAVDEQNAASDDVEIAVDHERADTVDACR